MARQPAGGRGLKRAPLLGESTPRPAAPHALYNLLQFTQQSATPMAQPSPRFGFVGFAETWNGRLAMLGFVIGLGTELLTGQSILSQIGLG